MTVQMTREQIESAEKALRRIGTYGARTLARSLRVTIKLMDRTNKTDISFGCAQDEAALLSLVLA